jgi:hypothetical protein
MDMQWFVGVEYANIYFDSVQNTSPLLAAAGTGVTSRHVANRYWGIGPHSGVELAYFLNGREWSLLGRFQVTDHMGRIHQTYGETTTTIGANGLAVGGSSGYSSSQNVPAVNAQLGLRWMPRAQAELFVGFQYEYFWNPGRESSTAIFTTNTQGTLAEVYDAGIVVRFMWNF